MLLANRSSDHLRNADCLSNVSVLQGRTQRQQEAIPGSCPPGGHETVTPEIILRFALAIGESGSGALLIDESNEAGGWASIEKAAQSGRAIAVEINPDVLALDADSTESGELLEVEARERMEAEGLAPVVVASGRIGHRHLFVRIHDPKQRRKWEEWARSRNIDVRKGNSRIRPPLFPHRQGQPAGLVYPVRISDALKCLKRREQVKEGAQQKRLSARTLRLLRFGDPDRGFYKSRSELVQAIVQGAINSGFGLDYIVKIFMDPQNAGGDKVREITRIKGSDKAFEYVEQSYRRALSTHRAAFNDVDDVLAEIETIRREAIDLGMKGRAGATDQSVLLAHLRIAARRKSLTYGASVREIAELAGVSSLATVSLAHQRLTQGQWLTRSVRATGAEAST